MPQPKQALYWIAVYKDGTGLPQYDPKTGAENRFSEIDQSRLDSFVLRSFDPELALKTQNLCNPFLPTYTLKLREGEKLEHHRHTTVEYGFNLPNGDSFVGDAVVQFSLLGIKNKFSMLITQNGDVRLESWDGTERKSPSDSFARVG